jgi:predicted metalloprotease with PDZ domain
VRVRLTRIDSVDLKLFEFDYDLTFMVFFMDARENVYARYGGRDSRDADNRQSLAGLRYTMQSVLAMHGREEKQFAPKAGGAPVTIRELPGGGGGKCLHCHQVKERLNRKLVADGQWSRDTIYRYPLPDNLGFRLEVHRGNVVDQVTPGSPAEKAGLKKGDVVSQLGKVPIHSFGDATYALDRAPVSGTLSVSWLRDKEPITETLELPKGWRKTDIRWRPSLRRLVPSLPLYGDDLTPAERKKLGLTDKQLAFRQNARLQTRAKDAGFRVGDIIVSVDDRKLDLTVDDFLRYIRKEYLVGERIQLTVLRDGKRLKLPLVLSSR